MFRPELEPDAGKAAMRRQIQAAMPTAPAVVKIPPVAVKIWESGWRSTDGAFHWGAKPQGIVVKAKGTVPRDIMAGWPSARIMRAAACGLDGATEPAVSPDAMRGHVGRHENPH